MFQGTSSKNANERDKSSCELKRFRIKGSHSILVWDSEISRTDWDNPIDFMVGEKFFSLDSFCSKNSLIRFNQRSSISFIGVIDNAQ